MEVFEIIAQAAGQFAIALSVFVVTCEIIRASDMQRRLDSE